jgi:hypothetical protein
VNVIVIVYSQYFSRGAWDQVLEFSTKLCACPNKMVQDGEWHRAYLMLRQPSPPNTVTPTPVVKDQVQQQVEPFRKKNTSFRFLFPTLDSNNAIV